jgi:hypothetical protein
LEQHPPSCREAAVETDVLCITFQVFEYEVGRTSTGSQRVIELQWQAGLEIWFAYD